MMPNGAETIEKLARELERQKLLVRFSECQTLDDFKKALEELRAKCEN